MQIYQSTKVKNNENKMIGKITKLFKIYDQLIKLFTFFLYST